MGVTKILPSNETVLIIPAYEVNGTPNFVGASLVPISAPTTALLNKWAVITSNGVAGSGAGGNISQALRDTLKLGLAASSTDKDQVITSTGQSEALTFYNFDAVFEVFVNATPGDTTSTFVMANDLIAGEDVPYIIVHRIGKQYNAAFAVGDEIDAYYVWTDNSIPIYTDGGNQLTQQTFITKNIVNISYTLAA